MSEANDRRVLQAYRAASEALDEAPAQDTRAAILAAAARATGARPQPVGRARRWPMPLAAAASVLVGAIAVLLATQVERQAPGGKPEVVAAAPPAAAPAADTAVRAATAPATSAETSAASATPTAAAPAPSRRDREVMATAPIPAEAPSRDAAAGERAAPAPVAADSAAPAPSAPAPAMAAAVTPDAAVTPENAQQRTQKDAAAPAAARLAGRAQGESRAEIAVTPVAPWRVTPEAWVERIVKLRAEGRHDEADAELAALRARHPDLRLPAAALSTSGR